MRLSKIKLCGFKSFVDPTVILLPSNLIGIVGPNGCGKSNVIDAVRWVMGESSAKTLRGESMTDVIFNGASSRKPVGQATVELIFDNTDGTVGGEYAGYTEISIKRLVNREAQSTYFLNGVRCRRRDITGIFLGTGLGPRSYSIIEQGMISRFIEAKPEELRTFLEEAAGISKYKERRRETENRMRHTRENLARVTDIRDELDKQLERLQRQSETAARFKEFKIQERLLKSQLQAIRFRDIEADAEKYHSALRELELKQAEQQTLLQRANSDLVNHRESHTDAQDVFNEVQKRFYGAGQEITRIEQTLSHQKEKRSQMQADLTQVLTDWDMNQSRLDEDNDLIQALETAIATLTPVLSIAEESLKQAQVRLRESEANMSSWQENWDEFNHENHSNTKRAEVSQTEIQHLEEQIKSSRARIERLQASLSQLNIGSLETDITDLQSLQAQAQTTHAETQRQFATLHDAISNQRDNNHDLQDSLEKAKRSLQTLSAKQASLETLQKAALGKSDKTVTTWLHDKSLDQQSRLVQNLAVEDGWQNAVETALGDYLQAVCVDNVNDIAQYVDSLHEGNVTLLQKGCVTPEVSDHRLLLNKISSDYPLGNKLSSVYCAESLEEALTMRDQLNDDASVITRDGIWLSQHWLRVTRQTSESSGAIAREAELNSLSEEITEANEKVAALQAAVEEANDLLDNLDTQKNEQQRLINEQAAALSDTAAGLKVKTARLDAINKRTNELEAEKQEARDVISKAMDSMTAARATWDLAMHAIKDSSEHRQILQNDRQRYQQALSENKAYVERERQKAHETELRLQTNQSQLDTLKQAVERLDERLESLSARREKLQASLNEENNSIPALESALEDQLHKRLAVEEEMTRAKQKLQNIEAAIRETEAARTEFEAALELDRNALEAQRLALQSLKVRKQTILENLEEEGITLEEIQKELPVEAVTTIWEEQIESLGRRITRLGAINLAAIEEYEAQSERKVYLDQQLTDLEEALATLEGAIDKIDKETKMRFKATYDAVNEAFKELFPKIFGGGAAYLELTGDDLLDTGVTVMAQPPGKRNSTIHLLSGGEKALTAMALVFSIFKLNPSPFCILDEVDAPLDDANVGRFCNLVKDMSAQVQFLFISHNKLAIEMSQQLIGVTMHEPGVSRLVAVDIDEAVAMAEV